MYRTITNEEADYIMTALRDNDIGSEFISNVGIERIYSSNIRFSVHADNAIELWSSYHPGILILYKGSEDEEQDHGWSKATHEWEMGTTDSIDEIIKWAIEWVEYVPGPNGY